MYISNITLLSLDGLPGFLPTKTSEQNQNPPANGF
jgi:hypothetical protein